MRNTNEWQMSLCGLVLFLCLLTACLVIVPLVHTIGPGAEVAILGFSSLIFIGVMVFPTVVMVSFILKCMAQRKKPITEVAYDNPTGLGSGEDGIEARSVAVTSNPTYWPVTCNAVQWGVLMCILLLSFCLLAASVVIVILAESIGKDMSLPICITLILTGVIVLPCVLITGFILELACRRKKSTDPKMADIYDNVCDQTEPTEEVVYSYPTGVVSGNGRKAKRVETTPNPARGSVTCNNVKWTGLMCTLLLYFCLPATSVLITLLAESIGTDIAIPVSLSLTVIGVIILPIVFTVYSVLICTRNSKHTVQWGVSVCGLVLFLCLLTTSLVTILLTNTIGVDIAIPISITLIFVGLILLPIVFRVCSSLKLSEIRKCVVSGEDEIATRRVEMTSKYETVNYKSTTDVVSIYDLGCASSELNEEGTCEHLSESTDSKMRDIYDYVCDPTEPNTEVVYDYPTGVGQHLQKRWTHTTVKCLISMNGERICDNPPQSTDSKMIDIHDSVLDPTIVAASREVEYDYPTCTGVVSGEVETAARRVEMTANPSYETVTCKSTTLDMVDEYDFELPELNEERTCHYLQESTDAEMTDTYDNAYDHDIIEPTKEVVYDYCRTSGVVSEEVETTVNPSYGIAMCKSTSPDMVDENDYEVPELNEQKTCDNPSQLIDPKLIDTYDNIYDSALIEPNEEVVYYDYPTDVGSGEDDLEARKVEFAIL